MKNQPSRDSVHRAKQSLSRSIPLCSSQFVSSMSKKNQNTKKNQDQEFGTLTAVPDGFTTRLGPNDKEFLVPQYLILALDQAFVTFRKKVDLEVLKAKPQVSYSAISTESFAASRHCHTCHSLPCLGNYIYELFPWLIFSMTDKSSPKQPLFPAWSAVGISPGPGEDNSQWLHWVELISF